jgi:glyoxylase-like metal-dependent hydrolase (beta-lactamase superfamily II)
MKKIFILTLISFNLILFVSLSFAQQQQPLPVRLQKIPERLYEVQGGSGANGGFYIGDNGVLVIDAKMDQNSVNKTIEEIIKITDKPIKYLVNTHSDGDHTAGNIYFPNTVTIIAHENCRKELLLPKRDGSPSDWSKPELAPFLPSVTFTDKMDIYLGSKKVELWYFGVGHTTGDIVVYFPAEKVAFVGDQFFATRPQLIHSYKGGNSFGHVKALEKMLETIGAEKFCSGHSGPADRAAVKKHIEQMKEMQAKVKSLIEKKKSLDEIKKEFDQNQSGLVESIYNELKSGS